MINFECAKIYCNEDISRIENYEKAVNDSTQTWDCHHRRGITTSKNELLEIGEYFHRPASELIFLTKAEHRSLHNTLKFKGKTSHWKGKHRSEETRIKMSEAQKGNKNRLGKTCSEETKLKISFTKKGHCWFNNGTITVRAKSCPEGFVRGRLKRVKQS